MKNIQEKVAGLMLRYHRSYKTKRLHLFGLSVKGIIDNVESKNYKLMPTGNGRLFLQVKTEIRKKIGKKEGDWVAVVL